MGGAEVMLQLKLPVTLDIELAPDTSDEWFTPPSLIESVRQVLNEIDLDPASCQTAQQVVRAKKFYTTQDDGLSQPWSGSVWLNPPYSMPLIEQFTARLVHEYQGGEVSAAITIVNNATETAWFHTLAANCTRRLDFKGRLSFWNPSKSNGSNRVGQVLFYFGNAPEQFELSFAHQGLMYGHPLSASRGGTA